MISRKMLANSAAQILFRRGLHYFGLDFYRDVHHVLSRPAYPLASSFCKPTLRWRHIIFDKPIIYETGRWLGKIESIKDK